MQDRTSFGNQALRIADNVRSYVMESWSLASVLG